MHTLQQNKKQIKQKEELHFNKNITNFIGNFYFFKS